MSELDCESAPGTVAVSGFLYTLLTDTPMTILEHLPTKERRSQAAEKAKATKRAREEKARSFADGKYKLIKMYCFDDKCLCGCCEKPVNEIVSVLNLDSMYTYQVCKSCACELRGISKRDEQYTFADNGLFLAKDTKYKILKLKRLSCYYFNHYQVTVGEDLVVKLIVRKTGTEFTGVFQFDPPTWDQYVFPMISSLIA